MAVRPNMADMLAYMRQHGQAANTDKFQAITYWTEQQLQDILDRHSYRLKAVRVLLTGDELVVAAKLPRFHYPDLDTVVWYNVDAIATPTTTYNFSRSEWTLAAKTTTTHVEASYVNMWEALADLWGQKAEQRHQYVNFKAGNNKTDLEDEYNHCIERQRYYRNRIGRRFKR